VETKALEQRLGKIPIFRTLGFRLEAVSKGSATLIAPYDPSYDGIFQSFHGGLLMTLADTAACVAVLTSAGANAEITTTDMNIRFLAPCRSNCTAEATVIKFGKTLCPVSVTLCDMNGTQVALAQVTYMRLGEVRPQTSEG
jgi:acyl-CoA thioesterase